MCVTLIFENRNIIAREQANLNRKQFLARKRKTEKRISESKLSKSSDCFYFIFFCCFLLSLSVCVFKISVYVRYIESSVELEKIEKKESLKTRKLYKNVDHNAINSTNGAGIIARRPHNKFVWYNGHNNGTD